MRSGVDSLIWQYSGVTDGAVFGHKRSFRCVTDSWAIHSPRVVDKIGDDS
jgi:hypothetical protein